VGLVLWGSGARAADEEIVAVPAAPAVPVVQVEQTNLQALIEVILQLQGQLHTNQLAIDQVAQETREAAAGNGEALSNGWRRIERQFSAQQDAFSAQSDREVVAMQNLNRSLLLMAGTFAAVAFFAALITGYLQWRTGKVWAEIALALRNRATGSPRVEEATAWSSAALDHLERRIQVLEHSAQQSLELRGPEETSAEAKGLPGTGPTAQR
jgi:hypothetical protein